jgi:hypothetical protein
VIDWEYVHIAIDDCTRLANVIYRRLRAWAETAPAMNPTRHRRIERFIRTMPGGWAYGAIYHDSRERTSATHRSPG